MSARRRCRTCWQTAREIARLRRLPYRDLVA